MGFHGRKRRRRSELGGKRAGECSRTRRQGPRLTLIQASSSKLFQSLLHSGDILQPLVYPR